MPGQMLLNLMLTNNKPQADSQFEGSSSDITTWDIGRHHRTQHDTVILQ